MRMTHSIGYIIATLLHLYLPWVPCLIAEVLLFVPALIIKLVDNPSPETEARKLANVCPPVVKHDAEVHSKHIVISGQSHDAPPHLVPH